MVESNLNYSLYLIGEKMKAITLDAFGDPSVLKYGEITTPEPDAGEVLIKVHNVSVNVTLDIALRKGNYPIKPDFPHVMGIDPVGEIVDVGREVSGDRVGRELAYMP